MMRVTTPSGFRRKLATVAENPNFQRTITALIVVNAMQSRYHAVETQHAEAAHAERIGLLEEVRAMRAEVRELTTLTRRRD